MKKEILFLFLICLSKFICAQDTIVKVNGEIIAAKILEINPTEIKFKKFAFIDGPTYIENKSEIKSIKYSSGLKEEFANIPKTKPAPETPANTDYYNPKEAAVSRIKMEPYGARYRYEGRMIGEREMHAVLMKTNNKPIVSQVQMAKDAHALQFVGFAAIPLGIAALYFLGTSVNMYGQTNTGRVATSAVLLGGAIACPIISGIYKHKRTMSNRKAVALYNQTY